MAPMMSTATAPAVSGVGACAGSQFGVDTTRTKVFVGGLPWETRKDAVRRYFQRFGDILEAVVITDKATGRSKGYGFVTFKDPEAAKRACADPAPVIDGRRANCNLAVLGIQKPKLPTPKHGAGGGGGWDIGVATKPSFGGLQCGGSGGMGAPFPSPAAAAAIFPHYAIQQGLPYNVYGYPPYSAEYAYNANCYAVYGGAGAAAHYPLYGGWTAGFGAGCIVSSFYPNIEQEGSGGCGAVFSAQGQGYNLQFPCMPHFSVAISGAVGAPQHYLAPMSVSTNPTVPGMATALPAPMISRLPHPYGLVSTLTAPVTPKHLLV